MSLEKAIRIGELLTEQKEGLKHGQWLPWIAANLPFSRQTVDNYKRCYEKRAKLLTVGTLQEAYKLLEAPKKLQPRQFDKILEAHKSELQTLKAFEEQINNESSNDIRAYQNLAQKAFILSNKIIETKIRIEREAGKLLNEPYLMPLCKGCRHWNGDPSLHPMSDGCKKTWQRIVARNPDVFVYIKEKYPNLFGDEVDHFRDSINQQIDEGLAKGKTPYIIGKEVAARIEKLFEIKLN